MAIVGPANNHQTTNDWNSKLDNHHTTEKPRDNWELHHYNLNLLTREPLLLAPRKKKYWSFAFHQYPQKVLKKKQGAKKKFSQAERMLWREFGSLILCQRRFWFEYLFSCELFSLYRDCRTFITGLKISHQGKNKTYQLFAIYNVYFYI